MFEVNFVATHETTLSSHKNILLLLTAGSSKIILQINYFFIELLVQNMSVSPLILPDIIVLETRIQMVILMMRMQ